MFRFFLLLGLILGLAHPLNAKDDLKLGAAYQATYAEGVIRNADITLVGIESLFGNDDIGQIDSLIIHNSLNRLVDRVPGLRALFTTDPQGNLQYDSYKYPTRSLKLDNRAYITEALSLKKNDLFIASPIKNPVLGFDSLPLSRPIFNNQGHIKGVAVAILTPDHLLQRDQICKKCLVSIFKDNGEKLVRFPANVDIALDIQAFMRKFQENTPVETLVNELKVRSLWTRSEQYGLIIHYAYFK